MENLNRQRKRRINNIYEAEQHFIAQKGRNFDLKSILARWKPTKQRVANPKHVDLGRKKGERAPKNQGELHDESPSEYPW